MSDDESLLRAVIASPDDLSLRQVYADWFEEQSDSRADFLRAELEWARTGKASVIEQLRLLAERLDPVWVARVSLLARIPIDSPKWRTFTTDGTPISRVVALLKEIQESREFGKAWEALYQGPILHQGTVYTSTYAALPHVVALAAELNPIGLADFWIGLGFIVAHFIYPNVLPQRTGIPDDLEFGVRSAIRAAEPLAVQSFYATDWSQPSATYGVNQASELALACLALSRHPVGHLLVRGPSAPRPGKEFISQDFVSLTCLECEAELEFFHAGDGIVEYNHRPPGPVHPDPDQPEPQAPRVPDLSATRRRVHPWGPVAHALSGRPDRLRTLGQAKPFPPQFLQQRG